MDSGDFLWQGHNGSERWSSVVAAGQAAQGSREEQREEAGSVQRQGDCSACQVGILLEAVSTWNQPLAASASRAQIKTLPFAYHAEGLDHFIAQRPSYDIQTYGDKNLWEEGREEMDYGPCYSLGWPSARSLVSLYWQPLFTVSILTTVLPMTQTEESQ